MAFMEFIFYDLETNGISARLDRILQVALSVYAKGEVMDYESLIRIDDNHVDMYAFHKNGWTEEYLNENGQPMEKVMRDVFKILSMHPKALLVGYFIKTFDNKFLQKMQRRYSLPDFEFSKQTFDIALEYKAELSGLYDRYRKDEWQKVHEMVTANDYSVYIRGTGYGMKIEDCCRYYGIPIDASKQHNAIYDTKIAEDIFCVQRPVWALENGLLIKTNTI